MIKTENFEQVEVTSAGGLRAWLTANHAQHESVWLVLFKKHTGEKYVSIEQVLDELICFGWIDSVARKLDEQRSLRLVGPRRVHHWAQSYKIRAARLTLEGRMQAAGLEAIEESKRRGLWDFLDDVDALSIPGDLQIALEAHPPALEHFGAFNPSSKRFTLRWIVLAKTPQTRAKRIEETAVLAAQNRKIPGS